MKKPQKHQIFAVACYFHFRNFTYFHVLTLPNIKKAEKFFLEHKTTENDATIVDDDEIFSYVRRARMP